MAAKVSAPQKFVVPPGAASAIDAEHAARMKFERQRLRDLERSVQDLGQRARDAVTAAGGSRGAAEWTMDRHASVMRQLQGLGVQFGGSLSDLASLSAKQAAAAGAERQAKLLQKITAAATGKRVPSPLPLDGGQVVARTATHLQARTADVGSLAGSAVGRVAAATSYLWATKPESYSAAVVAHAVADAATSRARTEGERVLVTEITAGYGIGAQEGREMLAGEHDLGGMGKVWDATLDRKVCAVCAGLHHTIVAHDKAWPGGFDDAPAHPRCLPPDAPIMTPDGERPIESLVVGDLVIGGITGLPRRVLGVSRASHTDPLVVITAGGHTLLATHNHPVLTQRGWVEAASVQVGDQVFRQRMDRGVASNALAGDAQGGPSGSKQVDVLSRVDAGLAGRGVPVARIDLDRDAQFGQGEVDVPDPDGELRHERQPFAFERVGKRLLDLGQASLRLLGQRDAFAVIARLTSAPYRSVSRFRQSLATGGALSGHSDHAGVAASSLLNTLRAQSADDGAALHAERPSNVENRPALGHVHAPDSIAVERAEVVADLETGSLDSSQGGVEAHPDISGSVRGRGAGAVEREDAPSLFVRHHGLPSLGDDASGSQGGGDSGPADAEAARDLAVRAAVPVHGQDVVHHHSLVSLCDVAMAVTRVERRPYAGDVCNIEVDTDAAYVAYGIVVHNCRCATLPWLPDWTESLRAHGALPMVRTGVQEGSEVRLSDWQDRVIPGVPLVQPPLPTIVAAPPAPPQPLVVAPAAPVPPPAAFAAQRQAEAAAARLAVEQAAATLKAAQQAAAAAEAAAREAAAQAAAAQAASQAAPPPPRVLSRAEVILHEQTGDAAGSNEGGFYTGADGVRRYVKFYADPAQAHGEHLANSIYRDLGLGAPESEIFEHRGRVGYASAILPNARPLGFRGLTKETATEVLQGFAADVLTANWDAVGLTVDNVVRTGEGLARIDNGGTFLMRAQAGRKPVEALQGIAEWRTFFDPSIASTYAEVTEKAGVASAGQIPGIRKQLRAVLDLEKSAGGWSKYVERVAPGLSEDDKHAVVRMLQVRSDLLAKELKRLGPEQTHLFRWSEAGKLRDHVKTLHKEAEHAVDVGRMRADAMPEAVREAFRKVGIGDAALDKHHRHIDLFTGGYRADATQRAYYATAQTLMNETHAVESLAREMPEVSETLHAVYHSRAARWRAALDRAGMPDAPLPTHLELHRGVEGELFVNAIVKAWADDGVTHVVVAHDEVASWSMSRAATNPYVEGRDAAVVLQWNAPWEATVADQVVDDSTFLTSFYQEHECVAGPGHARGLELPKHDQVVVFQGRRYTYEQRAELFAAMRAEGMAVP